DAGDRGRQRKGNVDDGVEQPPARKTITHQRPDDDGSHHQVDDGGGKGKPERNFQRVQRAAAGDDAPELIEQKFKRFEKQASERYQDDNGEPCQGQSHGETEPRQGTAPCNCCAHKFPCFRLGGRSAGSVLVDLVENAALGEVLLLRPGPTTENVVDGEKFDLGERFF